MPIAAYSGSYQPAPIPTSSRPPLTRSSVANALASTAAGRLVAGRARSISTHPALRELYPPWRRIILPARFTLCAGPSLIPAFDYLAEVMTRLAATK